jgi:SAM-dependent methyltransferase
VAARVGSGGVADTVHRREWEVIASLDPYWAVLSEPGRKYNRWEEDEFFATGRREVADRLAFAAKLGLPGGRRRALDFGCGLGRTARELARHFDHCVGLDISEAMLAGARELNAHVDNLEFIRADGSEPLALPDDGFDAVYSSIVLQHLPGRAAVHAALGELARVTAPAGCLCFQLPLALGLGRLQPRRTAYRALRRLRVPERQLYDRLGLHPMRMLAMPRSEVVSILCAAGLDVRAVQERRDPVHGFSSAIYYASKPG